MELRIHNRDKNTKSIFDCENAIGVYDEKEQTKINLNVNLSKFKLGKSKGK